MTHLPNPTIDAIYQSYIDANDDHQSSRLGASILGEECRRRLWYGFRWATREQFEGRVLRLFATGHLEEARVIADLRATGATVYDRNEETGEQFEFAQGHVVAKVDGVVEGLREAPKTAHLLEVKSANDRSFKDLKKKGLRDSKPTHYAQCQIGMGLAELTRAVYICVNKNTDEIYLERVKFDRAEFDAYMLKARLVIESETPPPKQEGFACKFCPHRALCLETARPEVNCRTCVHSTPVADGSWKCDKDLAMVPDCLEHLLIPDLIASWAEAIDGAPEWVLYKLKDGRQFLNCAGTGFPAMDVPHYASSEIVAIDEAAIGNDKVELVRTVLSGRVVKKGKARGAYPCDYADCEGTQQRDGNKREDGYYVYVCDVCGKKDWRLDEEAR